MLKYTQAFSDKPETYSSSVSAGDFIFISHQGGKTLSPDVQVQLNAAFDNLELVLSKSRATLDSIVTINLLLKNKEDFPACEEVFRKRFIQGFPARTTYVTDFVSPGILVQIDAIAYKPMSIA